MALQLFIIKTVGKGFSNMDQEGHLGCEASSQGNILS